MNILSQWLYTYFDELTPRDFVRRVFPEGAFQQKGVYTPGEYNGIIVGVTSQKKPDGTPKVKRYTVTDDLDTVDVVCGTDDFCLMSPISYAGKARTADNARWLYAFAVDLDRIRVRDGRPVGLYNLWERHIENMDRIPKPTIIVSSGTGLHLYYCLQEPVAMFRDTSKALQLLKRDLTSLIWHDTIVDIEKVDDIQQEGIYQGFRVPGTITKTGTRARAFLTGDNISIEDLQSYTAGLREVREGRESRFVKKKEVTLQVAREKYPDWYERRIVRKEPRGSWHVSRNVYDWWLRQVRSGASVGHRYHCVAMLAVYAAKCSMYDPKHNPNPVTQEELERDAMGLLDFMEGMTNSDDNHFTAGDVLDALEYFNEKWIVYPKEAIEYKSGIQIKGNKRNGRTQADHVKLMNFVRDELNQNTNWREGNGRPSKKDVVSEWQKNNPEGTKADCIRETGLAKMTVYKHWTK